MIARWSGIAVFACWLASCAQQTARPIPARQTAIADPKVQPLAPAYPSEAEIAAGHAIEKSDPATSPSASPWRADQPLSDSLAAGGAVRVRARVTDGSSSAGLEAIVFDSCRCAVRVVDQPYADAGGGAIAAAMRENRAVGGVNGGYFTPEFQPVGLMISAGRPTGAFSTTALLSGVVVSTDDVPRLLWRNEYSRSAGATDLVQAGPRLVDASRPLPSLDRMKRRPRTFIATDGGYTWAAGMVESISLGELAELLASPDVIPGFHVARALNLDGGRSSAIWMRTAAGAEISKPGWSTVRNFIAIVPRS